MSFNKVIINIIVIFMVLGAIDKCLGNKYGLGEKFDEGFETMGALALVLVGIVSLTPVLAQLLKPIVVPIYTLIGADPAIFAATLLPIDTGGYSLSMELAKTNEAGSFAGLILSTMMGATILFSIPVALKIISKKDRKFLAQGIISGIITIPIGGLIGGLAAGFDINMIISNLIPIIIVVLFVALGLWKFPDRIIKGFDVFGKIVIIIITIGNVAIIIETLTGIVIIPGMAPIWKGIKIAGSIAIMLAGAYPMVHFITKTFKKPLSKIGNIFGMNEKGVIGMITTLAHNIPMFTLMKDMNDRAKVLNIAFSVNAAFVFGSHLAFTARINKEMIFPMMLAKLVAGITAVVVAGWIAPKAPNKTN